MDREMNEAVALKLGWIKNQNNPMGYWGRPIKPPDTAVGSETHHLAVLPDYCHDIQVAWQIVEHLKQTTNCCIQVSIDDKEAGCAIGTRYARLWVAIADTAPKAICLAFLKIDNAKKETIE